MIVQHNLLANFTERQLGIVNRSKNKALEKLSSGYRINRAADDAAGLYISEKMRGQIRGLNQGARNVQDGINFCNTGEGALNEVHAILVRMKELAVQAANDTYVSADRKAINEEITALKKEINRISIDTEFNTYKIFARPFEVQFSDDVCAIQIFDAKDGDPFDPDSYGGIIVTSSIGPDTRVSWNTIDPNMVTKDENGQTVFKEGTYTYDTGLCTLQIECEDGAKPPEIKVVFPVEGTDAGIRIAGQLVGWKDILNEKNESILNHVGQSGFYHFNFGSAVGSFYVDDFASLSDIKDGINGCNEKYGREYINEYNGYYKEKAVDIKDIGSNLQVTNQLVSTLSTLSDLEIRLKADDTGIWMVNINPDGTDGSELSNSKKTWEDLGITSWDSGNDISDMKTYQYRYLNNGYDIKFNFTLLDETSRESVIAGINNAKIVDRDIRTSDEYSLDFTKDDTSNIKSGIIKNSLCYVSIYDEIALGRDFDKETHKYATTDLVYDKDSKSFTIDFKDKDGKSVISLDSNFITSVDTIKSNAEVYENYLIRSICNGNRGCEWSICKR